MKKILFLTDFSEVAKNAYVYALLLAEKINAKIHIMHIVPIIETKDPDEQLNVHPLAKFFNDTLEDEQWGKFTTEAGNLEKIAEQNNKLNVPVEFHFEKGIFLDTITDYIYEKSIDIVVMGTSGANTFDKKLFGSNTEKLINHIDVPLFAVPEKAVFAAINNITIAVMLNEYEYPIVQRLFRNSLKYNFKFNFVHVVESEKMAAQEENKKRVWLENIVNENTIVDTVVNTDVERGLENYIKNKETNILCIIHRNLSYLQRMFKLNHSNRLLHHSKTALLIYCNKI